MTMSLVRSLGGRLARRHFATFVRTVKDGAVNMDKVSCVGREGKSVWLHESHLTTASFGSFLWQSSTVTTVRHVLEFEHAIDADQWFNAAITGEEARILPVSHEVRKL